MPEYNYLKIIDDLGYFEIKDQGRQGVTIWFTTRFGHQPGDLEHIKEFPQNFLNMMQAGGVDPEKRVVLKQVHGNGIVQVNRLEDGSHLSGIIGIGDALITDLPDVPIVIKVADCLSIQLWDEKSDGIANIHCGWRSGAKNIITLTLTKLQKFYGFNPETAHAVLMPAIGKDNYQVGQDVFKEYTENIDGMEDFFSENNDGTFMFDLRGMAKEMLLRAGLKKENNIDIDLCTFERHDLFYSYRREGSSAGRMFAVIIRK
ncbi:MAG: polyphenol oxidase family protein [Acidobacteria bacterium]|nr:polyphenol oxidase family protein [Acidobacteriota bacterium]